MPIKLDKNQEEENQEQQSLKQHNLHDIDRFIWDYDSIKEFRMDEAIENHPLSRRPTNIRSKMAYADLLKVCKPTTKYLLPGQLVVFGYSEPKYKEELEYYDATPCTLFIGITRTKNGDIREIGLNLHYFPPRIRYRILNTTYEVFKEHFKKCFNDPPTKPAGFINWNALKHMLKRNTKVAFGVKMYIPVLRGKSYVLPTRLFPTAAMTEGHFSKATLAQVQHFWRQF
jgi:hypothetical protein